MAAQTVGTVVVSHRLELRDRVNTACFQCGINSHTVAKLKEIDSHAVSAFSNRELQTVFRHIHKLA
jgi:hypothetical protein